MRKINKYEPDLEIFRTQLWLRYTLRSHSLTLHEFAARAIDHENRRQSIRSWYRGEYRATSPSVEHANKAINATEDVFHLPLYRFVSNEVLTEKEIHKLMKPYYEEDGERNYVWKFPPFNCFDFQLAKPWVPEHHDCYQDLVYRADVHAFIALLGLYRLAEARRDGAAQLELMQCLYRILPAIERLPWIWPSRLTLRWCVDSLRRNQWWEGPGFQIDERAMKRLSRKWLILQDDYLPCWKTMAWDSGDHDPIIVYDYHARRSIPGEHSVHVKEYKSPHLVFLISLFFLNRKHYPYKKPGRNILM